MPRQNRCEGLAARFFEKPQKHPSALTQQSRYLGFGKKIQKIAKGGLYKVVSYIKAGYACTSFLNTYIV